jgi:Skp family chaperone for outer membrane proteins
MHGQTLISRCRGIALAAGLVVATFPTIAPAQTANAPVIAVLDIERILQQSAASKSMRPQIEKIRNDYRNDVKEQEGALLKAEKELSQQRSIVSAEVFAQKRREFEERARKAQNDVQERKRIIDSALGKAIEKIRGSTEEIARDLASERKIDIILPRGAVFLAVQNLDVTNEIMKRLDTKLPSVTIAMPGAQPAAPAQRSGGSSKPAAAPKK